MLLCTSGTAAANFHPAVVEAGLSDVGLLVVTADRPPELRDVGAAQTIDQTGLYGRPCGGSTIRRCPTAPAVELAGRWPDSALTRRRAARSHLNLPFREPLVGTTRELPAARRQAVATEAQRPRRRWWLSSPTCPGRG